MNKKNCSKECKKFETVIDCWWMEEKLSWQNELIANASATWRKAYGCTLQNSQGEKQEDVLGIVFSIVIFYVSRYRIETIAGK